MNRVAVVGGGIVGAAIARRLSLQQRNRVSLIEKEDHLGSQQSGHNSGVVHAGIYYRSDSLKARLVQEGRSLLQEFCFKNDVPYLEKGKIVVATNSSEMSRLDELERRALANKVPNVRRVSRAEIRELEPFASGIEALHSPKTAVVDYPLIIERLASEILQNEGEVRLGEEVKAVSESSRSARLAIGDHEESFDKVYVCAGIRTDQITTGQEERAHKLVPFRGEYLELTESASEMVRGLIYPVPNPKFPFLGVHFTRGHDESVHIGPNATLALARDGYRRSQVNLSELAEYGLWRGTMKLVLGNPIATVDQALSSLSREYFVNSARKLIPDLRSSDLSPKKWAGVRAQAVDRSGRLVDDFLFVASDRVTVVKNAPSPAATASLAIANYIVDELGL